MAYLDNHLRHRDFLLERFSVADAYLYTVLNWTVPTRVELTSWPGIRDYRERLQTHPALAERFGRSMRRMKPNLRVIKPPEAD